MASQSASTVPVSDNAGIPHPAYQTKADIAPLLIEFLHDLRQDDILTELVQNDLDQGATLTRISMEPGRLVAEGNGAPVDKDGWQRLTYVQGAGDEVAAKRNGIGVKNHGLRSCFLLGDEIIVRSGALRTQLTVKKNGPGTRFAPGAWECQVPDSEAPVRGCRIEVPFRTEVLHAPIGEGLDLTPSTDGELGRLFRETCDFAAKRFIGCVRPGVIDRYVLELVHWREGAYRFTYSAARLPVSGKRELYRRRCRIEPPDGTARIFTEDAYLFPSSTKIRSGRSIPKYFRQGSRMMLEISWPVKRDGRPTHGSGRFRYPIAYMGDGNSNARTSTGINFSGPFLSDTARHGLAEAVHTQNQELVAECEDAVVRILREHLVPRFGPAALEILHDADDLAGERAKKLVLRAANSGALPAAPRGRATRKKARFRCVTLTQDKDWAFIIPAFRWDRRSVAPMLSELAPVDFAQLHPGCPSDVLETLLSAVYDRVDGLAFTSFDEVDVVERIQPSIDAYFPWSSESEWKAELGQPSRIRLYLDVVHAAMQRRKLEPDSIKSLRTNGHLPDAQGEVALWTELRRASGAIDPVPGVEMPRQVHPSLARHPILLRGGLALPAFRLDDFLVEFDFSKLDDSARRDFFDWFLRNNAKLAGATLTAIAKQPVWPTLANLLVPFDRLCIPEEAISRILRGYLHEPHPEIRSMRRVRYDGRGLLRLRRIPSKLEVRTWYEARASCFPIDTALDLDARHDLARFEADLAALWSDRSVRAEMSWLGEDHLGVSEARIMRPVGSLHVRTPFVDVCNLRPGDIASTEQDRLYSALGAQNRPTQEAVVRALAEDREADDTLFARLAAFVDAEHQDPVLEARIRSLPFLAIGGTRYAPETVALEGSPDYWGEWKVKYDTEGHSTDRLVTLKRIGVTDRVPTLQTSPQFFRWLSEQDEHVITRHLDQVVRQFLHANGPLRWWDVQPRVRCLPVYARKRSVRLLSRHGAFSGNPGPLLPDFPAVEELILKNDARRRIVVVETESVSRSTLWKLKEAGLRTVRQVVMPPVRVSAMDAETGPVEARELIRHLLSGRMRKELQKRLQELGLPESALRTTWHHEIARIRDVRLAKHVTAHLKCGSSIYMVDVGSGIDPATGILWIRSDRDPAAAVFEAIGDRVFETGSPEHYGLALQRAVTMDYRSRVSRKLKPGQNEESAIEDEPEYEQHNVLRQHTDPEVKKTHHSPQTETGDQPAPTPYLFEGLSRAVDRDLGSIRSDSSRKPRRHSRIKDPIERKAISTLKIRHYASHCQACLAEHDPSVLAPVDSYAYRARNRQVLVHAHHVDPVREQGDRSISNVLLLCKHHHNQLGDQLERRAIRALLMEGATPQSVTYPSATGGNAVTLSGQVITVVLERSPWKSRLFFADEHARIWRTHRV